ncbi:tetratricopeptide repeat protein [Desulfoprunum benzoelyticum]|uniref:Tetratricopeptide (TPR) repeat protein n=1 Tax=Desulfoprunum benzoelyticum TaxID=1506996 RepID=A0A840UTF5_9BACT|nr:tetratricopeptide repeat protein [Desulfoprunum benzoelyticum]MBB5348955.1 tetratricopeptide (TPR) repeat protein [Desulfoprunum benzoelyticum]MBM9530793.1 tetratricopeptide repeat protein [Desulfoprunum benzoelyticum]
MKRVAILCIIVSMLSTGCAKDPFGSFLQSRPQKQQQLTRTELHREAATLKKVIAENPANPSAHYSYGRVLLALDEPDQAVAHLNKASILTRNNIDYLLWLGVAYGKGGNLPEEQVSYSKVLQLHPDHIQALVYLGNSYLKSKKFQPSLNCYRRALVLQPDNEQALYNRAIVYHQLQRRTAERQAWRLYLQSHSTGILAANAVEHLNRLKNFSYRNHRLGHRIVTLPAIAYAPSSADLTRSDLATLDTIGAIAVNMKSGPLDIIVYRKNDETLARARALAIKRYLEREFPLLVVDDRIRISWFNVPEKRTFLGLRTTIDDSTVFLLSQVPAKPIKLRNRDRKKMMI